MGAGKSTVGRLLAELLSCNFADIDAMIVQQERRSIAEIFAADGEDFFRDCETSLLQGLPLQPMTVYATGGGLVVRDENRLQIHNLGRTVYLMAAWTTLMDRLQQSKDRPLIAPKRDWDAVKALWSSRQQFYETADIIVETDGLAPLQVARTIIARLTS